MAKAKKQAKETPKKIAKKGYIAKG